ncbi:hypothetical protein B0H11DRAFT_2185010 [Mycena galericulata]|nr:hypothetical protein B0H11DRAFT_2185010 [Mycena galericulata]
MSSAASSDVESDESLFDAPEPLASSTGMSSSMINVHDRISIRGSLTESIMSEIHMNIEEQLPPTESDKVAKALVAEAKTAFDTARKQYCAGLAGPYILPGKWTLATFEALAITLESKWCLGYSKGSITLFGDPKDVHERTTVLFVQELQLGVAWDSHPDTPELFRNFRRRERHLIMSNSSATRQWRLTPDSLSLYCKEADALFTSPTARSKENGIALEVAHGNEGFSDLRDEVIAWTSGEGERVLLAVGVKINTKSPYQRDPQLRLLIRDCTHSSKSINCTVYNFGNGSKVTPRDTPRTSPPTPVRIESEHPAENCSVQYIVPVDPEGDELIVALPAGAALFQELQPDTFLHTNNLLLTEAYVQDLRTKRWYLDLGFLRYSIRDIIKTDAARIPPA